ncbi:MAG TPA: hypothetical protein VIY27_04680 [Myxococcota bacterium]
MSAGSAPPCPLRIAALAAAVLVGAGCEGSGSAGGGLEVEIGASETCTELAGAFPSGLALHPGDVNRALVAQPNLPGVAVFRLDGPRPVLLAQQSIPPDSDGDGVDDTVRSQQEGFFPLAPVLGGIHALEAGLALLSASNYEEVLFIDLDSAARVAALVENPLASGRFDPEDYPFLPPAGEAHLRTAVSTRACVFPPSAFDSLGDAIPPEPRCDPDVPGYFTNLTQGQAVAAGRLFVATANLKSSAQARFNPGSVLVYEWQEVGGGFHVRPDVDTPMLFTTGFNPTAATRYVTASGRELVLVTVTGAIGAATGPGNPRSAAAIDVVDAQRPRVAASIPLGVAGPSFDALAIDPRGRVALLGASSQRHVYAVDLAPLDDPRLYEGDGAPILLDGLTPGFPDARIFGADRPLVLPDRSDGPAPAQCDGLTHVVVDAAGTTAFATEHCDGTFTRILLDLAGSPPVPVPADRFQVFLQENLWAPLTAASIGLDRAPGPLRVRAGEPGRDYEGPDVILTLGQPTGQLCAVSTTRAP